ncbi:MAG: sigma-70 family RNA polymerase sigma factor [Terracidiphilus sp.]|jgi:RNA polymerase sigma-70 factor (ECF subfamily)
MTEDLKDRKANGKATECALVARILAGERDLFHELIRPHERVVYRMLFSMLNNEAEAEDASQAAIIHAYTNLARYRGESRFSTWLVTIALNEGRNRLRKAKTMREDSIEALSEESDGDYTPALLTDWREIPSAALERKEVRAHLEMAIEMLPAIYREVLVLRDVEGLDIEETAQGLSITPASVKVRLHRARRLLQKNLAPVLRGYAPKGSGWLGGWS